MKNHRICSTFSKKSNHVTTCTFDIHSTDNKIGCGYLTRYGQTAWRTILPIQSISP